MTVLFMLWCNEKTSTTAMNEELLFPLLNIAWLPKSWWNMSKQQNLSTFFAAKAESSVKITMGWDGSQSSRGTSSREDCNDERQEKKRVLPASLGGGTSKDSPATGVYVPKQYKSSYPSAAAYGAPKGTMSIGGVPFKAPAGKYDSIRSYNDIIPFVEHSLLSFILRFVLFY